MPEFIDLYVELCSDGSLLAYNKDHVLSSVFTDLSSWSKLHSIYECTQWSSEKRKGKGELNIKYVNYYFKNNQTGDLLPIPKEHIPLILRTVRDIL